MQAATLTGRLLANCRDDPDDALQQVAQAVLMQHGIRTDSVLRLERIAALAPPVVCIVMLAEWLAYVDWEGYDSALHRDLPQVAALIDNELQLPGIAAGLRQAAAQSGFAAQRPALVGAALAYIARYLSQFPE